jgi:hypothetical protein
MQSPCRTCYLFCSSVVAFAALAWKETYWGLGDRMHYTLVALAAVGFAWWLDYWNLSGNCLARIAVLAPAILNMRQEADGLSAFARESETRSILRIAVLALRVLTCVHHSAILNTDQTDKNALCSSKLST